MAVITSEVTYLGDLRTEAKHLKSGQTIYTDAPPDNQGKGEAFSPTDLAATSLATCMMTIMGIAARTHNIDIKSMRAEVQKIMADNPRRIDSIVVNIYMPGRHYTSKEKLILERAAHACPVSKSLSSELKEVLSIHWQD